MAKKKKWDEDMLVQAVQISHSYRQVIAKLGLVEAGGNYEHVKRQIASLKLDTTHFTGMGWRKGRIIPKEPVIPIERILVRNSTFQSYKLKLRLFSTGVKEPRCEYCGWAEVSKDGRVPVELDHINGDRHDNRLENLQILCPNCHSLQPTHRGRNIKRRGGEIGKRATLKML